MAIVSLTQEEFETLMAAEKHYEGEERFKYPHAGKLAIELYSRSLREDFILDISRSSVKLSKHTFQNRARVSVVLVRLDLNGAPHRNPDDEELPGTHFHIYRYDSGDKWAYQLPEIFTDSSDVMLTLDQFMDYCKIISKPKIDGGAFL